MKMILGCFLTAALIALGTSPLLAATASVGVGFGQPSPLQQGGGAALVMNGSDTVTMNSTVVNDAIFLDTTSTAPGTAQGSGPTATSEKRVPSASLAVAAYYSPYLKVYSLPLSWTFNGKLRTELTVPYIDRTLKQSGVKYSANGLGDMSLGLDYSIINDENWDVSTILGVTFPTGDVEAKGSANGKTITVPLGSGAYSINLVQNVSYNFTSDFRVFASGTFRYFTDTDYTSYENNGNCQTTVGAILEPYCRKHEEKGMLLAGLVGSEYKFRDDMSVTGRFSLVDIEAGKQSFNGGPMLTTADALLAGDASLTLKWRFFGNATFGVTGIYPVLTRFDPSAVNPEDRTWGISFAFLTQF